VENLKIMIIYTKSIVKIQAIDIGFSTLYSCHGHLTALKDNCNENLLKNKQIKKTLTQEPANLTPG
jgi:hypothetical protein